MPASDENDQLHDHHTHPTDWRNPAPAGRYNLVVLGGGTAGLVCAAGAAGLGAKVALIERDRLGGDCLNVGCVPSKALLRCARAAAEVRRAGEFGVEVGSNVRVDFAAVMHRMRRLRAEISPHDSAERLRNLGVDVFFGEGRFVGQDAIEVQGQRLDFARAVIASGSLPADPAIPGLAAADFLTNETVFALPFLPARLAVIGAGPIGCELSQAFARFGSEVHLIHRSPAVLPREEAEASAILKQRFEHDGIRLHLNAQVMRVEKNGEGRRLVIAQGGQEREQVVDAILVAVGRHVDVTRLGLEAAGVASTAKGVTVNDFLQTINPRIYAAGDACGSYQFTHAADEMARIVLRNALFFGRERLSRRVVPWCTYTEPEVARVGLSVRQSAERRLGIRTIHVPFADIDRAVLDGEADGFAMIHIRQGSDRILGSTIVAAHAGEMIGVLTLAMNEGLGLSALSRLVQPYPTVAEAIKKAGDAYQKTRLTPRVARWMRTLLRWRRGRI
jgi:pyruvate/2-oxoglutarate dehydrogenase complex dihydrolipoamide dehydrogenase (E3) component